VCFEIEFRAIIPWPSRWKCKGGVVTWSSDNRIIISIIIQTPDKQTEMQCECNKDWQLNWIYLLITTQADKMISIRLSTLPLLISFMLGDSLGSPAGQQVWDVERLIRARNPGAVFTTTERADVTWQTLRSITYSPTLGQGAVGSASVQEASLVRRFKGRSTPPINSKASSLQINLMFSIAVISWTVKKFLNSDHRLW